jgi:hydroxymethylpyrimidine/phosphomethylpyrimidine kinase
MPAATKLGLVPDACVEAVAGALASVAGPVVFDPVLRASDGGFLESSEKCMLPLFDRASLVTPNVDEAAALAETSEGGDALLEALVDRFPRISILLKGGHDTDECSVTDRLFHQGHVHSFTRQRQPGPDIRGTGCALATAIACALASRTPMVEAVAESIAWLDEMRPRARPGPDGRLHLPL